MPDQYQDIEGASPAGERPQAMDEDTFRAAIRARFDDAVDYIDSWVAPSRAQATDYYKGGPLGNEEAGRNQIVMTEVRDKTLALMPDLMRIFTSSDRIADFSPNNAGTTEQATQQTEVVNHVFYEDNPGFLILYSLLMDGNVRKAGFATWRWSDDETVMEERFSGLEQGQIQLLLSDRDVEVVEATESADFPGLFDVVARRYGGKQRCIVEAVPPEEVVIARDARDLDTASYIGRRQEKTFSDLVAMGYPIETLEEYAGSGDVFSNNLEAQARNPAVQQFTRSETDQASKTTLYAEHYARIDRDGDGIAELRRVCTIGGSCHVLLDEVIGMAPVAAFCPIPEPHTVIGMSVADQVSDLQRILSRLTRDTLDSLSESIRPRTWMVEGMVNEDDMLNNELGGVIRMRQPGMAGEFNRTFLGRESMPVIKWFDDLSAKRTGITGAAQGLDPDVMQSTTKAAVQATVQGAQARTELIARVYAETGLKRLMKGIRDTLIRHQDRPRTIRLTGGWVEVDPRVWDASLDVRVNVALGRGNDDDKVQSLVQVAAAQEKVIMQLGPFNPLCDLSNLRETYAQIIHLMGFKDAAKYFKELPPQLMAQLAQQAAQAPKQPQDPGVLLAQIEQQKAQFEAQAATEKLKLQKYEIDLENQRKYAEMRQDLLIKIAEIQAKNKVELDIARLEAATDEALSPGTTNGAARVQ